ncbi:uncharacterized protein LOC131996950 [Stomoxys calcitrans]|uniref:uncharacterized protein LOC131996950 n=1 Tax=Stomoxys calcitrans TaxID=35570 RepID=UPI0027E34567|nr:uncharacterized protein LOC131996950 [Stomoxys calcitrans]
MGSEDGKTSRNLIIVPDSKIIDILAELHDGPSGGHLGITKTAENLKQRFYEVGCQKSIADWVANFERYMKAKRPKRKSRGHIQQYNSGAPYERIAMDLAGQFPISDLGNRYVLVVMEYFSKWPEVYAQQNQKPKTIVNVISKKSICRYGAPSEIHSDQGRNFESAIFKEMFNRTLEEHLRKVVDKGQKDWDMHIPKFLLSYRSAVHDSTSQTPAKILFGSELKLHGDLIFGGKPDDCEDYRTDVQDTFRKVHDSVRH